MPEVFRGINSLYLIASSQSGIKIKVWVHLLQVLSLIVAVIDTGFSFPLRLTRIFEMIHLLPLSLGPPFLLTYLFARRRGPPPPHLVRPAFSEATSCFPSHDCCRCPDAYALCSC